MSPNPENVHNHKHSFLHFSEFYLHRSLQPPQSSGLSPSPTAASAGLHGETKAEEVWGGNGQQMTKWQIFQFLRQSKWLQTLRMMQWMHQPESDVTLVIENAHSPHTNTSNFHQEHIKSLDGLQPYQQLFESPPVHFSPVPAGKHL